MATIPRDVAQTMLTKLDLGQVSASDAKKFAAKVYGVELSGRTREQVATSICKNFKG